MTNRPRGNNPNQQRVTIAIGLDILQNQEITAFFTFGPQPVFRTAEKSDFSEFAAFIQGLLVHKPQHQHFTRLRVLNNRRDQAIAVF